MFANDGTLPGHVAQRWVHALCLGALIALAGCDESGSDGGATVRRDGGGGAHLPVSGSGASGSGAAHGDAWAGGV